MRISRQALHSMLAAELERAGIKKHGIESTDGGIVFTAFVENGHITKGLLIKERNQTVTRSSQHSTASSKGVTAA